MSFIRGKAQKVARKPHTLCLCRCSADGAKERGGQHENERIQKKGCSPATLSNSKLIRVNSVCKLKLEIRAVVKGNVRNGAALDSAGSVQEDMR